MLRYPVTLERNFTGTILVSFPDIPEAHTFGGDREEALARAPWAPLEMALSFRKRRSFDTYGRLPYRQNMDKHTTTARLEARLPVEIHALLKRAAEIQGRTLTDFVVSAASDAARRAVEEAEIIRLSVEGQRQMAEAILNPPAPADALRRAFKRRKTLLGLAFK